MKLTITASTFLAAVTAVAECASTRSNLPILGNLLLEAADGALVLTGNDLDRAMRMTVNCDVHQEGKVTLAASRLVAIAKASTGETLEISVTTEEKRGGNPPPTYTATVTTTAGDYQLPGLAPEEFPAVVEPEGEILTWTFKADVLRNALAVVAPCQSDDRTRYVLQGVCMDAAKTITWVATDGRHLAMYTTENEGPTAKTILPSLFVRGALRLLESDGQAVLRISDHAIALEIGQAALFSKQIEGSYPNYRQIVPTNSPQHATLKREPFLRELQRVAVVGENIGGSWVAPALAFDGRGLEITQVGKQGTARRQMEARSTTPLQIKLDQKYINNVLRGLSDDEVRVEYVDGMSPVAIRAGQFTGVIMPLRTAA